VGIDADSQEGECSDLINQPLPSPKLNATCTHAHIHTHACTNARTYARRHARTPARRHTRLLAHTRVPTPRGRRADSIVEQFEVNWADLEQARGGQPDLGPPVLGKESLQPAGIRGYHVHPHVQGEERSGRAPAGQGGIRRAARYRRRRTTRAAAGTRPPAAGRRGGKML
jgi:hypothetical protein